MTQSFSPLRETVLSNDGGEIQGEEDDDYPFHITSKPKPSVETLKKWRKATLALNATRRFRYTLNLQVAADRARDDLNNGELVSRFRTVINALRAVQRFKQAGQRVSEGPVPDGFDIGPTQLANLMQDPHIEQLEEYEGVDGIAKRLRSNVQSGIEDDAVDVERRKEAFGSNRIPPKPGKGFLVFVWEACHDTTLIILMVCAAVSFGTEMWSEGPKEGWYDGVSIAAAVMIVIAVTATSDYRQSLQFLSLSDEKKNVPIDVVRGGRRLRISVFDVVVGDIVNVNIGDQIPADGIFVSGQSLTVDEASMTGESLPVYKSATQPFMLSGCKISDGYGSMLVTAVGVNTEWGRVMATLNEDNGEETPLQVRLNGAATFIGQIGLSVAILVFIILFIRFFAVDFKHNNSASNAIKRIVNDFAIAVTIVVVAVPEGLPLAVTLTLAYSMRKMMRDKALVRNLAACETMGSATTICSDKTGTLTLNEMSVTKSWVAGKILEPQEVRNLPTETYQTLLIGVCQNSSGTVYVPEDGGGVEVSGSPTESAALSWGVTIGMNFSEIKNNTSVLLVETFNSLKKRAGVLVLVPRTEVVYAHWKGAAEMILEISDKWVDVDGSLRILTEEKAKELRKNIEGMAALSLRCIAYAYREIDRSDVPEDDEEELRNWKIPDGHLTFLAVIGIKDPCRPGVKAAVERCQAAQIMVRMVTGDSVITAKAIAQECGILTKGGTVVEGKTFRNLTLEEQTAMLPNLEVMARSSPTDKLLLVKALKSTQEVVAVTGDGTNDAPALREADVGLSMGISGTEVAKENSDVVILDDNFASIVKVVRWGRSVYANIQKFIQFQLTVNVTALVINFVAAVSSGDVPLTAVQLLWVNLIMDTLGALALATEEPTDDLMQRAPVGRREPLITNIMWRNLFGQAIYQIVVLMTINYGGKKILKLEDEDDPDRTKNTIVFNAFVFCQIFNEVNSRRPEKLNIFQGLHRNYLFMSIIFIEIVFQFLIVQFLNKFATTTALTWQQWVICVAIGSIAWPLAFVVKFIPVREKPFINTRGIRSSWRARMKKNRQLSTTASGNVASRSGSKDSAGRKSKKSSGEAAHAHVAENHEAQNERLTERPNDTSHEIVIDE